MPAKKKAKKTSGRPSKTAKKKAPTKSRKPTAQSKKTAAKPAVSKELVECTHCDGTGKCAAGNPYDRMHHQGVFAQVRLTSCRGCLEAAGESRNSKKMIGCRFCHGLGKVEKQTTS